MAASLLDKINHDLVEALKAHDEVRISTLRFLISGIKNARIAKGQDLMDDEVIAEIAKDAKRHKESIDAYEKAGRVELADKEKAELVILQSYLPAQLPEEEISKIVNEIIAKTGASGPSDIGKVMGEVMARVKGQADGTAVSKIVQDKLSGAD